MCLELKCDPSEPKVLSLFWKGELWRKVSRVLFLKPLNSAASFSSFEDFEQFFIQLELKIAFRHALLLLSRRSYLSTDLVEKLVQKGVSRIPAEKGVEKCRALGYLDDAHVLKRLVAKEQKKGIGAHMVAFKLNMKKGISDESRQQIVAEAQRNEKQALIEWLNKRQHQKSLSSPQERKKLMGKLMRRGFSYELISECLKSR
jgi:SOS response regulatory protein OraA/RecX